MDVEDGNRDGLAGDLELPGVEGPARAEGDVGGSAAHVEGDHPLEAGPAGPPPGSHHPTRRAGEHRVDGLPGGAAHGEGSSVGPHDPDRTGPRLRLDPLQVARDEGRDVGVDHGGGRPLVLPVFGEEIGGEGERDVPSAQRVGHLPLVAGIGVGVEEDHRQRFGLRHPVGERFELGGVEGLDLLAAGSQAASDPHPVVPGHQRREPVSHESIELGTVLAADLDDVLEAPVGDEDDPGAGPLQEGVGGHRGAVEEEEGLAGPSQELPGSFQDRLRRVCRGGADLQDLQVAAPEEEEVRERAARVHGQDPG